MELVKAKDNLTYTINDVTFYIRADATVKDKFELDSAGEWKNGGYVMNVKTYWMKLIELFVTGWTGVTENGKDVPYSMEALMRLPADGEQDWLLKLGSFIANSTGIMPVGKEAEKNA